MRSHFTMESEVFLQRLFSTFPDGWPGLGLALFRLGAGIPLIYCAITRMAGADGQWLTVGLALIAAAGGVRDISARLPTATGRLVFEGALI